MKTIPRLSSPDRLIRLLMLIAVLVSALVVPSGTARAAAGQLRIGQFGMIILNPPSGGEVAFSLQNAFPGSTFVTMRVDWATADTRVQQIQFSGVPGAPINGFDLNSSTFEPQPRQPDQIVLNVHPPARSFHDTFMFELSHGMGFSGVIGQIALIDLSSGEQRTIDNVPVVFDPVATSDPVDLTNGGTQTGGLTLVSGGQLTGGNGASVTGPVVALPGSSVQVTQGQLTLGDGSGPVKLAGQVDLQPDTTLKLNSSSKAELSGQTNVNQGTIDASSGMLVGSPGMEQQMDALMAQLQQQGVAQRAAAREASLQQRADELQQLQDQASQLRLNAELALYKGIMATVLQFGSGVMGLAGVSSMSAAQSTLVGNVNVAGTLKSGDTQQISRTDVQGDLKVASGAQLEIKSAGTGSGQTDKIAVSGNAIFNTGAILKLALLNFNSLASNTKAFAAQTVGESGISAAGASAFTPQLFDEFDILTAQHITSQGILVDAPSFADRTFIAGIFDNPDGTQTLRLIVVPYSDTPIDTTAPTASPTQSPAANGVGWNNSDVTVNWNWSDAGVGTDAANCTSSSSPSGEGTLALSASCADFAGNQGSAAYTLKIDKTAPALSPVVSPNPAPVGGTATVSPNASDAGSGIATASCGALDLGSPGAKTVSCTATDKAGNTTTASASYTVLPASSAGLLDTFNRANGQLGANWGGLTGSTFYAIAGNQLDVQLGGPLIWKPSGFGTSQEAFITLSTIDKDSPSQGVLLKVQGGSGPESGAISVVYDAVAKRVRVATLRLNQPAWTAYSGAAATFANGDKLTGRVLASGAVQIYKNSTLLATVTLTAADKTFFNGKGGKIGVWTVAAPKAVLDDFGGGTSAP